MICHLPEKTFFRFAVFLFSFLSISSFILHLKNEDILKWRKMNAGGFDGINFAIMRCHNADYGGNHRGCDYEDCHLPLDMQEGERDGEGEKEKRKI